MKKLKIMLALSTTLLLLGSARPVQAAGGWLGIHPETPQGIQVGDIIKDSPADKSGLQRGDVILRLNGQEVANVSQFMMEIFRLDPGTEVTLSVHRKGEIKEIKSKLETVTGHSQIWHHMGGATMPNNQNPLSFNRNLLPRQPGMGGAIGPAHTHDYQTRLTSTWSLLEAFERIAEEKQLGDKGKQTSSDIRNLLNQAQEFFSKYKLNEGMNLVEQAYSRTMDALIQVRSGETLVQTKNFETPEAEYLYEIGRNNVFQMLVEQGLNTKSIANEQTPQINEARSLRTKAEENAVKKEFPNAIGLLEKSSDIMIELLRKSGLEIP